MSSEEKEKESFREFMQKESLEAFREFIERRAKEIHEEYLTWPKYKQQRFDLLSEEWRTKDSE